MSNNLDLWLGLDLPAPDVPGPTDPALLSKFQAADDTASQPANYILLPGNGVSISDCAKDIFARMAASESMYLRGGAIMEVVEENPGKLYLRPVTPASFRSRIEKFGKVFALRVGANHAPVFKPTVCPEETAKGLMASEEAQMHLPPISMVIDCPVIIEENGNCRVLGKGYHPVHSGILVTDGGTPQYIEPLIAIAHLLRLIEEFDFQTPGDRARAFAMMLAPALKMGGIIEGSIPIGITEADQSQAGKTYFAKLIAALYNECPAIVTLRKGGVGSVDESFSQALVRGRPFILFDNFRGKLDSPYLESFLTATSGFAARVPHHADIQVDPTRFVLMMTSNGVEITPDLANRASIIRIRKRQKYFFRQYPEGDLLAHIKKWQSNYLGCVFSIIAAWVHGGKLRTDVMEHDFREWAQILDHITKCARIGPLLDDHRQAQVRVSSRGQTFLRNVAVALRNAKQLGINYSASDICSLCEEEAIKIPGMQEYGEHAKRQVGILMKEVFRDHDLVEIETFIVRRSKLNVPRPGGGNYVSINYEFTEQAKTPHS